jgi:hypothetical protein
VVRTFYRSLKLQKVTVASHHTIILREQDAGATYLRRLLYARDQDGQQTRTVHTPGGNTQVGTQTFSATTNGHNKARLFERPDEEARRKDDAQSIRNARTKAKLENETDKRARVS